MKAFQKTVLLSVCLLALAGASQAAIVTLTGTLLGSLESPANISPGVGSAVVTLDTVGQLLQVSVVFSGLLGTTTASHIHCCVSSGNAGVATSLPSFPGFPLGVTSGSYSNTFDLTLASSYSSAFVTAHGGTIAGAEAALITGLQSSQTYLNIHTNLYGGGEIRTFLQPVPEPVSASLVVMALGALWLIRRRQVIRP